MLRVIKIIVIISTFVCCEKKIAMKFDSTIKAPIAEKIHISLKSMVILDSITITGLKKKKILSY